MHIIKAMKTGNTIAVCVPAILRRECSIDQSTFFTVTAPNKNAILFTRVASVNSDAHTSKSLRNKTDGEARKRAARNKH